MATLERHGINSKVQSRFIGGRLKVNGGEETDEVTLNNALRRLAKQLLK